MPFTGEVGYCGSMKTMLSGKIVDGVLDKIDKLYKDHSEAEVAGVCGHLVSEVTKRMVMDALSVTTEQYETMKKEEILKFINEKFKGVKTVVEIAIVEAFEAGVKEASNRTIEYDCAIGQAAKSVNGLPC